MSERLDSLDMFGATMTLPEQISQAVAGVKALDGSLPQHDEIENVVVLGMGGSGIGGDVLREIAGPFMAVPVVVHKGYGFPNFISESTLVFVLSFSGGTEETLEAASEAAAAGGRGLTHAQYLAALVALHESARGLAESGDEQVAAELERLGLQTVTV